MAEVPDLSLDPASLTDAELSRWLLDSEGFRTRLESAYLAMAGEWNARRAWASDGALNGGQWLRHHAGIPSAVARSRVRFATNLRRLEKTAAALAAGEISVDAAKAIAFSLRPEVEAVLFEDEELLIEQARRLSDDQFFRAVAYWRRITDPDGSDASDEKLHRQRRVHLSRTFQGAWVLDGLLEPEVGSMLKAKIDEIAEELWRADQATLRAMADRESEAEEAVKDCEEPTFYPDGSRAAGEEFCARTAAQRRADALGELARRGMPADDDPRPDRRPVINLTMSLATFVAKLAGGKVVAGDGTDIAAEAARRLGCDASFVRVLLGAQGEILDLGRSTRVPSVAQRRALTIRDRGCAFPSCDRPASWCDAHHVRWVEHDGPTDLDNLVLLCTKHHRLIHHDGFGVRPGPIPGRFQFTRPGGSIIPDGKKQWPSPPPAEEHRRAEPRRAA